MKKTSSSRHFSEEEMRQKLLRLGQEHLLEAWKNLSKTQKSNLIYQLLHLDEALFQRQQRVLFHPTEKISKLEPFEDFFFKGSSANEKLGKDLIAQGKCACLIVAGGQGSRLRFEGPKGCFPVSLIKKKSLFQLLAEKIKAAGLRAGRPLECAIMTSPLNHIETETFFNQNGFFGLSPSQIHFFYQDLWPLLNFKGNLFLEEADRLALGPNGNGGALERLKRSHILTKWKSKGIEIINFIPIDNVLADPFDSELFGFHASHHNDVSIKATLRTDPEEKVGVLVKREGKAHVVEYSEFPSELKEKRNGNGLYFPVANLSLFSFSISFIEKVTSHFLPLHRAKKVAKCLKEDGSVMFPEEPNAWKFEEFIFDVLPFAEKAEAIIYPREECFAALKNFKGVDSIETVQAALQTSDRKAYFRVSEVEPSPSAVFELSQEFYYPTEALIQKWKGKPLPAQPYIEGL